MKPSRSYAEWPQKITEFSELTSEDAQLVNEWNHGDFENKSLLLCPTPQADPTLEPYLLGYGQGEIFYLGTDGKPIILKADKPRKSFWKASCSNPKSTCMKTRTAKSPL